MFLLPDRNALLHLVNDPLARFESSPAMGRCNLYPYRYVADFESMLRRVLAERDGGMIAVTLMSSDMGKLYAALAQAIDKRR